MLRTTFALVVFTSVATASPAVPRSLAASSGTAPIDPTSEIMFAFDSSALGGDAPLIAGRMADWLFAHPGERVVLEGHTDRLGSSRYNDDLAKQRTQAVRDQLIKSGVPDERIVMVIVGEGPTASSAERRVVLYTTPASVDQIADGSRRVRNASQVVWVDRQVGSQVSVR